MNKSGRRSSIYILQSVILSIKAAEKGAILPNGVSFLFLDARDIVLLVSRFEAESILLST